jgi:hypothetical protein
MAISVVLNYLLSIGYYKFGGWQKHSFVAAKENENNQTAKDQ